MLALLLRTLIIYFLLVGTLRLSGKRQIGQLQLSELIIALLLSELASSPLSNPTQPLLTAVVPILLLVALEVIISFLVTKSSLLKRMFDGRPTVLIRNGVPDEQALLQNRISLEELLSQMRLKGAGRLEEIDYAILEQSGQISFLQKGKDRPPSAQDLSLGVPENGISHAVVVDGVISERNLSLAAKDMQWLNRQLGGRPLKSIFLMTVDDNGNVCLHCKADRRGKR